MCAISDKLKLCTCVTGAGNLRQFWVLYRHVKGKNEMIIGQPVLPCDIDPVTDSINRKLLLRLLNGENVFDKPLYPVARDRLQLSFTMDDGSMLSYGFVYKKDRWSALEFDYFGWFTRHDEIKNGKIKNGLKNSGKIKPGRKTKPGSKDL